MRVYCRPGATHLERLEAQVAFYLRSRPETRRQLADLLAWTTWCGPVRKAALHEAFSDGCVADPAEALGMARAALLLCGVSPERNPPLTGDPREDFLRLMEGRYGQPDPGSASAYAAPSILDAYCHMGAGFARGMDRVFTAATGRALAEHLRQALRLLETAV